MSTSEPSIPVVRLRKRRALPFFARHPWVFAGAIAQQPADLAPGSVVQLHSAEGEFIAYGLYNPASNIRVRLYSWGPDVPPGEALWRDRVQQAVALRRTLFGPDWSGRGVRAVFSESDGLSGLTVDCYDCHALVQWTSRALWEHRDGILQAIEEELRPRSVWMRTEKGIREAEGLELADGPLRGRPPRPVFIEEHGVRFGVDVTEGQKTGFYLDQRDNRLAAARYMAGRRVLDLFCYTGGFGLTALKAGAARQVLAVDSSASAVEVARANAELNELADRCHIEQADVTAFLGKLIERGERFDAVILDPPKYARSRAGVPRAVKAYVKLNTAALNVLDAGGILVTCSCSGLVDRSQFFEILAAAAREADRTVRVLEQRGAAADHPVATTCVETDYLKCFIAHVE